MQSIQGKAMLTKRNLEILTFLLNYRGWISGDDLAAYFDLNRKTVQAEIRDIQYELKDSVCIETGKKGCAFANRCPFVTEECLENTPELRAVRDEHFTACVHVKT